MSSIRRLDRKEIFAALAVHVPTIKSQYYSLQVLLDEQRRKSSEDPWEGDIERLEKIRNTLRKALLAIDQALERMVSACARCQGNCESVTRVCSACSIC